MEYSWRETTPVRDTELTAGTWSADRRHRVKHFEKEFAEACTPVLLALPGYAVGTDTLILDGTHRAAAAFLAKADMRLLLFILRGPTRHEILPDLAHYEAS